MVKPVSFKCLNQTLFSLPAQVLPVLQSIILKIKALGLESATRISNTIIENMSAFIEQHNEGHRVAERLRQAAQRIFGH